MAADYLGVNKAKLLGNRLVRSAELLAELRDLIDQLNGVVGHSFAAADYSMLEANFGLTAGQGANVATLIGLIHTILNTSTDVPGANRLSQLNEFVSRLSGQ